jgi:hypothetical protein
MAILSPRSHPFAAFELTNWTYVPTLKPSERLGKETAKMRLDLDVAAEHDRNHYPLPADDDTWQESWAFAWYDPAADVSGWHHASVKRPVGVVDLKSWVSIRGKLVHSFQTWNMPVPQEDYSNIRLGPIRIRSLEPLTRQQIDIVDDTSNVSLVCEAMVGPHWFQRRAMDLQSHTKAHWENYSRFAGHVVNGSEDIKVAGFAFISRSWGPRDLTSLLTHRIIWACFGEDLTLRLFLPTTNSGPNPYGFVVNRGELHHLSKIRLDVTIDSDGANPLGCEATVWTEHGEGYRFSGHVNTGHAQTNTHPPDAMYSHASTVFELGGRLGSGFLQVNELKRPTPWDLKRLGLA